MNQHIKQYALGKFIQLDIYPSNIANIQLTFSFFYS